MIRRPPYPPLFPYTTLFRSTFSNLEAGRETARFDTVDVALLIRSVLAIVEPQARHRGIDRKSTRLNSSHLVISYAVFCLKKKRQTDARTVRAMPCSPSPHKQ